MSAKVLAGISFKLFAIYLLTRIFLLLPSIWAIYLTAQDYNQTEISVLWPIIIIFTTIILGLIMCKLIWQLGSNAISNLHETINENVDIFQLEKVLLQILGLFIVITSFVDIPSNFTTIAVNAGTRTMTTEVLHLVAVIVALLIGLSLFIKVEVWAHWLKRLRQI